MEQYTLDCGVAYGLVLSRDYADIDFHKGLSLRECTCYDVASLDRKRFVRDIEDIS